MQLIEKLQVRLTQIRMEREKLLAQVNVTIGQASELENMIKELTAAPQVGALPKISVLRADEKSV